MKADTTLVKCVHDCLERVTTLNELAEFGLKIKDEIEKYGANDETVAQLRALYQNRKLEIENE